MTNVNNRQVFELILLIIRIYTILLLSLEIIRKKYLKLKIEKKSDNWIIELGRFMSKCATEEGKRRVQRKGIIE